MSQWIQVQQYKYHSQNETICSFLNREKGTKSLILNFRENIMNNILYKILFVFLCIFISSKITKANTDSLYRKVQGFGIGLPQEKVYLHLDNTCYFLGDTIWYKGYVTRSDKGTLTDLSKILYVELLTPDGYSVERQQAAQHPECSFSKIHFMQATMNYVPIPDGCSTSGNVNTLTFHVKAMAFIAVK